MKKTLFALVLTLLCVTATARPVDAGTARRAATTFMSAAGIRDTASLVDITKQSPYTEFYIFASEDGGFILVSADDCVLPILGYSVTGEFPLNDMPVHVAEWLDLYAQQIAFCRLHEVDNGKGEAEEQWNMLVKGVVPPAPLTAVSPMLSTTWNQSPRYNNLCPYDSTGGGRSVSGCTATATAQIMKFWNHPTTGYGSHSYNTTNYGTLSANFGATTYQWSSMPNSLNSSSSTTQINAVATLMYHIGVAAHMNYSASGSGAATNSGGNVTTASAENALKTYFRYSHNIHGVYLLDFTDADWKALLRNELDNGRPLLYTGYDTSAGHAFVFDGYNNNGLFHVNWGWGGSYDGYYAIGTLNPGSGGIGGNSTYTFNLSNSAVIGIQPVTTGWGTGGTVTVNTVGGTSGCSVSGGGTYGAFDTVTLLATAAAGYRFDHWSDGNKYNPRKLVVNSGNMNVTAHFVALSGDTLSYCGSNGRRQTSYSVSGNNYRWGIKLPASTLTAGHSLSAVQLYVSKAGTYTLNIHTGASSPTTLLYTSTHTFTSNNTGAWNTIPLTTPVAVDATQPIWISFTCSNASYPAAVTYYSGNNDGMCWGNNMTSYSSYRYTFMIRALFVPPLRTVTVNSNDTTMGLVFGSGTYHEGSTVTVHAAARPSHRFIQWNDGVTTNPRSFVLTCDTSFTAIFDSNRYMLNVVSNNPDWGTVSGGGLYSQGSTATIVATPSAGYRFLRWNDGFTDNPRSVTVNGDATYTAYFEAIPPCTIHAGCNNSGWGTVEGGGLYPVGATATLTAIPVDGYRFVRWQDYNTENPRSFTVTGDANYIAFFEVMPPATYIVTVVSNNPEWGTVGGSGTYTVGYTATLTATPNDGYHFVRWHDGNTSRMRNVTVTADTTYTAFFEADQHEGVDEIDKTRFLVYPNPATTILNIVVDEYGEAVILDVMGRMTASVSVAPGTNTIDVSTLPNGVYFIKVSDTHSSFIKR